MQRHEVSKCWGKNGAGGRAPDGVATDLPFVKTAVCAKRSKAKPSEMRCACVW